MPRIHCQLPLASTKLVPLSSSTWTNTQQLSKSLDHSVPIAPQTVAQPGRQIWTRSQYRGTRKLQPAILRFVYKLVWLLRLWKRGLSLQRGIQTLYKASVLGVFEWCMWKMSARVRLDLWFVGFWGRGMYLAGLFKLASSLAKQAQWNNIL